jgi:hypothetical protein
MLECWCEECLPIQFLQRQLHVDVQYERLTGRFCSNNKVRATFSLDHPPSASLPYALSMTSVKASSAQDASDASTPSTVEIKVYQALSLSQPFFLPRPTSSPVTTRKSSIFAVVANRAPELTIAVKPKSLANRKSRFSWPLLDLEVWEDRRRSEIA